MELKEICEKQIKKTLREQITKDGMLAYIKLAAKFPQMPYYNLLLILRQYPNARVLCGAGAWRSYKAEIPNDAKKIALLNFSVITDEDGDPSLEAVPVIVFDINEVKVSDRTPAFSNIKLTGKIEDALRNYCDFSVSEDEKCITGQLANSSLSRNEKTIYIRKGLSDKNRDKELLKRFTEYLVIENEAGNENINKYPEETEDYLYMILCAYFGLLDENATVRNSDFFSDNEDEKRKVLFTLSNLAFKSIEQLTNKKMLSFNEIMLCNRFFTEPERKVIISNTMSAVEMTDNKVFRLELLDFYHKLSDPKQITDDNIKWIYEKRLSRELFTFPLTCYSG